MANNKTVIIKIKRQLTPDAKPTWEEFEIAYKPNMNVTSALMEIAANPVTRDGKKTTPVTYDSNCLEEVCGSCAMLINGTRAHGLLCPARSSRSTHQARAVFEVPRRARPVGRPQRDLREPEEGQSLGSGRRHVRPRLRPARVRRGAGRSLSALALHLLLLLHGSLPAVQRRHRLRRRRHHLAGAPVQHASHRRRP